MERIMTEQMLDDFKKQMKLEEKSKRTVDKYVCDVRKLMDYAKGREITKELVLGFKDSLVNGGQYVTSSINTFLVAANRFLAFMGWGDACVKTCKMQRATFTSEKKSMTREEYELLVAVARRQNKERLALILTTLCAIGIRIGELKFITAQCVRTGCAVISNKGKVREVLLPADLQEQLMAYMTKKEITDGPVFRTASGKPVDRSNIWREIKALCEEAGVDQSKAFPHNFRHLFAKCFYAAWKDIVKLADVLGHDSIETTRIYIRTTCEEYRQQLEMLGLVV